MHINELRADFETWLREDQDRGDLTVKAYLVDVHNFAIWLKQTNGRESAVERVTPTDIKDYRTWLQAVQKQKASSINRRLAALAAYAHWLEQASYVKNARNPVQGVKAVRETELAPKWLDKKQRAALLRAVDKEVDDAVHRYPRLR